MEFIEEQIEPTNEIQLKNAGDIFSFKKAESFENDPFNINLEDIKKLNGLGTSFKRKVSREFTKSFTVYRDWETDRKSVV